MTDKKVVTRFAPSPTGYLHIGGARTALFNWLFARHMGGTFRLRIEDTDKARSSEAATQAIIDGMAWLGLEADGEIVFQSQREAEHIKAAEALIEGGHAYRCYLTDEEIAELRGKAREAGHAFRSPWRDKTPGPQDQDRPHTVRFRVPDGQTQIKDHVQGDITWENDQFDDLVLLRADGTPTYMLAVVVDDHDMGVTHVIRGDDHLINAGRQTQIYEALDWDVPEWAHVPLIHGPDGKKLSKRHGALAVEGYRDMGYLPSGLRNYLLKLGWSKGDQELYFGDEAIKDFTLAGINAAPARLDFDKMDYVNAQHILLEPEDRLIQQAMPFLEAQSGGPLSPLQSERVHLALETLRPRAKTLKDFATQAAYLLATRPLEITPKAQKSLKNESFEYLRALLARLEPLEAGAWIETKLKTYIDDTAAQFGVGFGKIGQPLRAVLTGGSPAPDLTQVLLFLGPDEALGRIQDALA